MDFISKKNYQEKSAHLGIHSAPASGGATVRKASPAVFAGVIFAILFSCSSVFSQPMELDVSYSFDDLIFSELQGYDLIEVEGEKT